MKFFFLYYEKGHGMQHYYIMKEVLFKKETRVCNLWDM